MDWPGGGAALCKELRLYDRPEAGHSARRRSPAPACEGRVQDILCLRLLRGAPAGLDLIDALYDRLMNEEPATDLASPAVVKTLEFKTAAIRKEASASGDPATLGMLWDWKVTTEGQRTKLWMSTDEGGTYLFTIDTAAGRPRVSAAEDLGGAD